MSFASTVIGFFEHALAVGEKALLVEPPRLLACAFDALELLRVELLVPAEVALVLRGEPLLDELLHGRFVERSRLGVGVRRARRGRCRPGRSRLRRAARRSPRVGAGNGGAHQEGDRSERES
jgi:hypothetical protein